MTKDKSNNFLPEKKPLEWELNLEASLLRKDV
jgi:hypothetical protein